MVLNSFEYILNLNGNIKMKKRYIIEEIVKHTLDNF